MTKELLLNARTRQRLDDLAANPAPAVLVVGPAGSGKTAIARQLAAYNLGIPVNKLPDYPYFTNIQRPDGKQEIPIDSIRQIIREMRLKPAISSQNKAKRVILVEDAGNLSEEAQNALLKTLEEPGEDTVFIMTAESDNALLPTIASRVQKLAVTPVGPEEASAYFGGSFPSASIESAWQLSQGAAGLLSALLTDDAEHPLKIAVGEAKRFLKQTPYERALYLDGLGADKVKLTEFLNALSRVLAAVQSSSAESGSPNQQRRLSAARRKVNLSIESLSRNTSPRLIALHLSLSLPL